MITKEDIIRIITVVLLSEQERKITEELLSTTMSANNWSSIAVYLEEEGIGIVAPLCLLRLNSAVLHSKEGLEQEVYLRVLLIIGKKLGTLWTKYRNEKLDINNSIEVFIERTSQNKGIIEENGKLFLWSCTMEVYQLFQLKLNNLSSDNLIVNGLCQEVLTIVHMLQPQERHIFSLTTNWYTDRLQFRTIQKGDESLLENNLTSNVGKFLSIEGFFHPLLTQEYIHQSILEMKNGTCLVLMIFDFEHNEFIGSCTLNDINKNTAEIGLWIKESKQNKGYGTEILDKLLEIIKVNKLTKQVLYTVEEENIASIALCQKNDFIQANNFILEPNFLKNKYRRMIQFLYEISK